MFHLWYLGALSNTGELTPLGRKMVEFPLDPTLAKMLIFSEKLGCVEDVATVVRATDLHIFYYSDADAAAFGGDERWAQGAVVPPDLRSLAQTPPRISSFCVCAPVPFVYKPSMYYDILCSEDNRVPARPNSGKDAHLLRDAWICGGRRYSGKSNGFVYLIVCIHIIVCCIPKMV